MMVGFGNDSGKGRCKPLTPSCMEMILTYGERKRYKVKMATPIVQNLPAPKEAHACVRVCVCEVCVPVRV